MLSNYIKTALRNFLKNKITTAINIVGLGIGITCCIFIMLYVSFELSYDNYHEDLDRIYRIPMQKESESRKVAWPTNTAALAPILKDNFSQVESVGRLFFTDDIILRYNDKICSEDNVALGDQDIFNILSIEFILGDKETALTRPGTVVLTEKAAVKYFGDFDPIGKMIISDVGALEVTGVIENSPQNTHMKFNIIASLLFPETPWWMEHWPTATCYTYVKLIPSANAAEFGKEITEYVNIHAEELQKRGEKVNFILQPVKDIHLHSNLEFEKEPPGDPLYLYIFSATGLLILLISCINFVNLTTARYSFRIKEVGIRKIIGAHRSQIVSQLLLESVLFSFIALVLAAIAVERFIPLINNLIGVQLKLEELFNFYNIISIIGLSLLVGILAGIYPALSFSSYESVFAVKNAIISNNKLTVRKILIIGQFIISIALIILSLTIYQQIHFMRFSNPGFDLEKKLIIQLPSTINIADSYEMIKEEFEELPMISGVTASSHIPGQHLSTNRIWLSGKKLETGMSIKYIRIDHDFLQEYKIEMLAGRPFIKSMESDKFMGSVIINEAMMYACGWNTPEEALNNTFYDPPRHIIGVTKNFHFRGFQHEVEPLYMNIWPERFGQLTLTIETKNLSNSLLDIENKYLELFPNSPYEYYFLGEIFEQQYFQEEKVARIFGIFTLLGIIISCLGMYGLVSFITEQRTKEIGIRKACGARISNILIIVTKEFLGWVIIGTIIAWPIAYFLAKKWLQNFAFKSVISFWIFILSGVLALLIAIVSVSWQSLKAACKNPVESLRYE